MGSAVITTSNATDNRLAVTDNGLGVSSSGTGNNTALTGHILNINAGRTGGQGYKGVGGSPGGDSTLSVNVLDAGAIGKAFDFAAYSLSEMLGSIIDGNKRQQETAQYTVQTIGSAIQQASSISAAAAAASAAADKEINGDNQAMVKKGLVFAGLGFAGWWFFMRGKK